MKDRFKEIFEKEEIPINKIFLYIFSSIRKSKFAIIGIFFSLMLALFIHYNLASKIYISKATVIYESDPGVSGLNSVTTMLGVSPQGSASSSNLFDVEMYDEIVSSESFLYNLSNSKIPKTFNSRDSIYVGEMILSTLRNQTNIIDNLFFKKDKSHYDWRSLNSVTSFNPQNDLFVDQTPNIIKYDPIVLSVIGYMKSNIEIEKKDKFISVSAKMTSPYNSAILSKLVLENLVFILKKFKIQRQLNQIQYLERKVIEAKKNYLLTQKKLASNKDQSLGLIFESSNISEQNLTNDNSIAFNIYNQAALQLEQSKSNLKIETPVFTTLDQIQLPKEPFSPNFFKLLIFYLGLGVVLTIFYLGLKSIFNF
jgi:hypothetical protein